MRLDAVNEIINQAKAVEFRSRYLQRTLTTQSWQLPELISVDADPAAPQLLNFIIDYIELAPQTLACIANSAKRVGLDYLFQPFLQTAMDYFMRPAIILNFNTGLDGLMIRAYQCHRLIEELYENNRSLRNSKICELESTQANLLVHHLIGEPFANEIDESVIYTMSKLVRMPEYYNLDLAHYIESAWGHDWQQLSQRWQRLLAKHQIHFNLYLRLV